MNRSVTELLAAALFLGLALLGIIDVLPFAIALGPIDLGRFGTTVLFLCVGGLFLAHGYAGFSKKPESETPESKGTPPARGATAPDPEEESAWDRFKANVRMIGGAVLLAVFIRIVLFEAFEIDGPSMEPTLQNGDRVVVAKMLYGLFLPWTHEAVMNWGEPNPGDVVIVNSPLDGVDIVKRVIGVAGDTIEVRDRVVFRNGEALPQVDLGPCLDDEQLEIDPGDDCHVYEETLGDLTYRVSDSGAFFRSVRPVTIPEGHIFVRGDHRDRSNDSTNPQIGAIPVNRIKGRALAIYLSCIDEPGGWWICDQARWDRLFQSVR